MPARRRAGLPFGVPAPRPAAVRARRRRTI